MLKASMSKPALAEALLLALLVCAVAVPPARLSAVQHRLMARRRRESGVRAGEEKLAKWDFQDLLTKCCCKDGLRM